MLDIYERAGAIYFAYIILPAFQTEIRELEEYKICFKNFRLRTLNILTDSIEKNYNKTYFK